MQLKKKSVFFSTAVDFWLCFSLTYAHNLCYNNVWNSFAFNFDLI